MSYFLYFKTFVEECERQLIENTHSRLHKGLPDSSVFAHKLHICIKTSEKFSMQFSHLVDFRYAYVYIVFEPHSHK